MPLAAFHPTVARWFADRLGAPTRVQEEGWRAIRAGRNALLAAPTGSGKTLAAFLVAIDGLLRRGADLADATEVLYVSPLRALSHDVRANLEVPLRELRALDPSLPEVRVLVRTGDTKSSERAAMTRRPPHVLVTTPESLYLLLTSDRGREMLRTVRTVIVDEIHALAPNRRGAHLALSLERLVALAGDVQRVGLSATQRPIEEVARFLVGEGRTSDVIDAGHLRHLDLALEVPSSPLAPVCSHDTWKEIHERIASLVREHRTTLVFVNTRKLAERTAARLGEILGPDAVAAHHGSLSREKRLETEERLRAGALRAVVATASLELGIDIGDVDLVVQVGATPSIATLLQRVGRAGHGVGRTPKGRVFPLTQEELIHATALVAAVRAADLDRLAIPAGGLDVLAQQIVAAAACETWDADALFAACRRAHPYRDLPRADFDAAVALHATGRTSLLHVDGVNGRIRGTRRARLTAITCGGAIPDNAAYEVRLEPDGTFLGTLDEDFAVESSAGDIVQLGTASWKVLKIEPGIVRVADAQGAPPTVPFWRGEAPSRTREVAAAAAAIRALAATGAPESPDPGVPGAAWTQVLDHVRAGVAALGALPSATCVVLERFFDETGGMQLVLHAPFGGRINRAWGLALRKRFCRGFGFELQAAANEDAILLSLAPQHSFRLEEVFDYLHPNSVRHVLEQAVLGSPLFLTRWRWNVTRSLVVPRFSKGRKTPPPLLRMRADDALAAAFPEVLACPETLPGGDVEIPLGHPVVRQTMEDCLREAMDVDGLLDVLRGLREGRIRKVAVDLPEPSAFARSILVAQPWAFLDDGAIEERRTQAVLSRRALDVASADTVGALDPAAVGRVREEAWPDPRDAEEVHEALLWMGYATVAEAAPWETWLEDLRAAGRAVREDGRWFAAEATREPKAVLRGRMEALGPVVSDDPLLAELEREGAVLRCRIDGREQWCDRRLLARIHRATLDRLRAEIEPVAVTDFLRFLASWQHASEDRRLDGPRGVAEVVRALAGFEAPAASWEASLLPQRVRGYRRDFLDQVTLSGEVAWGRLFGSGASAVRSAPVAFFPREDADRWLALAAPPDLEGLASEAREVLDVLTARGASFPQEIERRASLLPSQVDRALAALVTSGAVTCDSFAALRRLVAPPSRRREGLVSPGRWSVLAREATAAPDAEFVARALLRRWGVLLRRLLERERIPVPWRDLVRVLRRLELRGDVRGGRFVAGLSGEQYALPESVEHLRRVRREIRARADTAPAPPLEVAAADPLNLRGILTPEARVAATARRRVEIA